MLLVGLCLGLLADYLVRWDVAPCGLNRKQPKQKDGGEKNGIQIHC
jgi:hypothetical protein